MAMKFVAIAAAITMAWISSAALARVQQCAPYEAMVEGLETHYGESPVGIGVGSKGKTATNLFISPETGSWTILRILPNGVSCVVDSGKGWTVSPAKPDGHET